jgi:FXSXX-COOH protein
MTDSVTGRALRRSSIVDVSRLSLADLATSDDTVLAHSIRQLLADAERSTEAISGWSSYLDIEDDGDAA